MKLWNVLFLIFFIVILTIFFLGSIIFLISKASVLIQQSTPFSPLDDNLQIENTERCSDSDGGIFFDKKGEVSFKQKFIFFEFNSKLEDRCNGNQLTEYYCLEGEDVIGHGVVECSDDCIDGACFEIFID